MSLILRDIVNIVSKSLDIKQDDTKTLALVKNATNEAYLILSKIDKRITRAYVPIVNGILTIPENSLGVVKTNPILTIDDRIYGNSIVTNKEGIVEIYYYYMRELLEDDEDELELNTVLQQAVINYVCYILCNDIGDTNRAESFYNAYYRNISMYDQENLGVPETVLEVDN